MSSAEPDIAHVPSIKGQGDAPAQALYGPRDAQIAQRAPQKAQHLVAPDLGLDERGVLVDVVDQPVLVLTLADATNRLSSLLELCCRGGSRTSVEAFRDLDKLNFLVYNDYRLVAHIDKVHL